MPLYSRHRIRVEQSQHTSSNSLIVYKIIMSPKQVKCLVILKLSLFPGLGLSICQKTKIFFYCDKVGDSKRFGLEKSYMANLTYMLRRPVGQCQH